MIGFLQDTNTPVSDSVVFGQYTLTNHVGGVGTINNLVITNCNARWAFVDTNTNTPPTIDPPKNDEGKKWEASYTLNDDFSQNAQGGDFGQTLQGLTSFLIKRKKKDDINDPWVTIFDIPVNSVMLGNTIYFYVRDYYVRSGTTYMYCLVPVSQIGNARIEYVPDSTSYRELTPMFDSIFICSRTGYQRLTGTLSYDDLNTVQLTGVHETLGSKYPIVVANSQVNYQAGGVSATILNKEFLENMKPTSKPETEPTWVDPRKFNREKLRLAREEFESFITDKTPKIIKDMNGNMWLVMITDNVTYSFYNTWGMGLGDIHFTWTEIGDVESEADLEAAGMIGGVNTED